MLANTSSNSRSPQNVRAKEKIRWNQHIDLHECARACTIGAAINSFTRSASFWPPHLRLAMSICQIDFFRRRLRVKDQSFRFGEANAFFHAGCAIVCFWPSNQLEIQILLRPGNELKWAEWLWAASKKCACDADIGLCDQSMSHKCKKKYEQKKRETCQALEVAGFVDFMDRLMKHQLISTQTPFIKQMLLR